LVFTPFNRLRGRDPVAEYYAWLVSHGRVTEGRIIDQFEVDEYSGDLLPILYQERRLRNLAQSAQ
jgi:hypothetical protein